MLISHVNLHFLLQGDNVLSLSPKCFSVVTLSHAVMMIINDHANTHCKGMFHHCHSQKAYPEQRHEAIIGARACRQAVTSKRLDEFSRRRMLEEIRNTEMQKRMKSGFSPFFIHSSLKILSAIECDEFMSLGSAQYLHIY